MLKGKKITVIIPAYNEEEYISTTVKGLEQPWVDEIIIVNDGSIDSTAEILKELSVSYNNKPAITTINLSDNQGKARAVEQGYQVSDGDIIVLIDADLGNSVVNIREIIEPVVNGETEVGIAVLPLRGGGFGLVRTLADWGLRYLTKKRMRAPLSGQRVLVRGVMEKLLPLKTGFGLEIGMDVEMVKQGINFQEINCQLEHRVTGKDIKGFIHRAKQLRSIIQALWDMKGELDGKVVH